MLSVGIVGLPNVGKSTLFNALTKSKQADAQNYPFCTIEPNVGVVEVPDERLQKLSDASASKKVIPTAIEFVDIAGLVKGASEGEGLGNKFLSHIREVDAIAHVVRHFESGDITHVENRVDPKDDAEIINLELVLADWQSVSKRLENTKKRAKSGATKEVEREIALLEKVAAHLESGKRASLLTYSEDEYGILKELCLLTMKPMMYIVNVAEAHAAQDTVNIPTIEDGVTQVVVCAQLEAEFAELSDEDRAEYMKELGMNQTGLDTIVSSGYELLQLVTYFTSGEQETRAWTVTKGTDAQQSAGVIHTDFIKGFIKADVVQWKDFADAGGWNKIKETGNMRLEGKTYIVQDGDVIFFHVAT